MDRSVALTLVVMALLLGAAAAVVSVVESPLAREGTWVVAPGQDPELMLSPDDPIAQDMPTIFAAIAIEASRRAPWLVGAITGLLGGVLWFVARGRSGDPWSARAFVVLAPLLATSAIASAVFTPPDAMSMLLLLGLQWAVYVPVALALLAVITRLRREGRG